MALFTALSIAASGMFAESQRLATVASNLANANSTVDATGQPYRAREVVFEAASPNGDDTAPSETGMAGVRVAGIVQSAAPLRTAYDPGSSFANAKGYVQMPNVDPIAEMVNMISAQQDYQADLDAFNAAKTLALHTLSI
jgi:flagellar basal-body rod protein FlgC